MDESYSICILLTICSFFIFLTSAWGVRIQIDGTRFWAPRTSALRAAMFVVVPGEFAGTWVLQLRYISVMYVGPGVRGARLWDVQATRNRGYNAFEPWYNIKKHQICSKMTYVIKMAWGQSRKKWFRDTAPQNHFFLIFLYRGLRYGLGNKPSVPLRVGATDGGTAG
jgi:hypothetical protein